jgi:mannose-6-phosphate isomerase-like protein (cupin superfamily)
MRIFCSIVNPPKKLYFSDLFAMLWLTTLKGGNFMDAAKVTASLKSRYPGGIITCIPSEGEALEIVCETRRYHERDHGEAIAIIVRSEPHHHDRIIEVYRILFGELVLHVDGQKFRLSPGDIHIVTPGQVHWAEGEPTGTWVKVISTPIWSQEDHHLDIPTPDGRES